ncbi:galactokinase [Streptomyces coelicolor]|uniref:Galactokinase n=2 Tax=Streptomyces TaxID=1883 RepID=GAL1_STRCO|nr:MULTISPECIES: galactokinase [Streptomyces]Q9K3S8.1 RecName: Full=Galactokinase; AltName: Full=Galactose kinase [Streptomyces coelicolor A3(2)]MBQ0952056.1 galactokinase [Streptomyces sp. RK76]MCW8118518.1 galactokinase [Streptomyces anthocyanicus]MCZ4634041.1 galactokinase [Streptomyces rubrogriseus]MDX2924798.1 galactokinase [Streptomyces sp. NRRL_B-16638]MDX3412000.1 galactokinase [Streptomyces sp. ME02-6977A]
MGEAVAGTVGERFRELYGAEPEGVWAAPGRVNLIGEHTDYNDGFVMPFALPHQAVAAVSRRDDGILRLHSADIDADPVELRVADLAPGSDKSWTAYPSGVLWALREAGHELTGADVHLASTVPSGAGLSSSAALEVVLALAMNDLYALGLRGWQLARLCQRAENVYVGAPVGIMDQTASACCEAGHALFLDTRDLSQRQIPFDLAAEGMRLLVVDTRVKHSHSEGEYGKRRAGCEKGAALLGVDALRDVPYADLDAALERLGDEEEVRRLVRHVVTEDERVERVVALLESGDTRAIGAVLVEGHASLRDDFRISCPELDLVVDTALASGALGARMTGGGFGGSAIVLVEAAGVDAVTKAVEDAFAAAGLKAPRVFEAVPSAGARRLV